MKWIALETEQQLADIQQHPGYSIIFKHSTRCSISMMARRKFEMDWDRINEEIPLYFLDLLKFRNISAEIAERFHVHHESPQLLLIKEGECILDQSHGGISVDETLLMVQ
ncbi:bacillithiol system redox-active protein YtxJ [Mucilaginibacter ginkgonis]|uniref:Bacillithiol system redox-active protein YtxJ n=1 Tax=Mucilaginibacter ginkgonis TaxID=2682091 RepID=A0A6I4I4U2_9SPHI|nr:bacillithiol system redox-active protein YtxJ [Mucilaginibacter ginkgonis]QQL48998.1 bacillithiol system redox-active protein YtxJ [Mucilaginibacter ginkgonis]